MARAASVVVQRAHAARGDPRRAPPFLPIAHRL